MVKGAQVVFAKVGVLEGIGLVDFVGLGVKKPKMTEAFPRNELELRNRVWVGHGSSQIGNEGVDGSFCCKGGLQRGSGVM